MATRRTSHPMGVAEGVRRQDRVKTRQDPVRTRDLGATRVCDDGMTLEHALGVVAVVALLIYLVSALVWPHKF